MIRIDPTVAERQDGQLSPATLQRALAAMRDDGVLVLQQVIDPDSLDHLKQRMDQDSLELLAYCESMGGSPRDRGHLQQGPPPFAPFVNEQLIANTFVAQFLNRVLGADAYCEFYNGNTNCPDSSYQQLHLDAIHPDLTATDGGPTVAIVMNVVPQDVDEYNGAVELWPGTQQLVVATPVDEAEYERRRCVTPPIRGVMRKGDVLLRDSRLWHRGVPNLSEDFRHMLGLVFVTGNTPRRRPLLFSRDCETLLAHAPIAFHAEFTAAPIDYLLGPTRRIYARLQGPNAANVTRH